MPASKAQIAETAERRAELIRLRRAGKRFADIWEQLGYSSRGAATKDFLRALQERRDEQAAEVSIYRQEESERLDALLEAVWDRATTPQPVRNKEGDIVGEEIDLRAVDTALKIADRRAKLMGLDAPVRTEVSGPDGGAIPLGGGSLEELHTLIAISGPGDAPEDTGGDTDQ